MSRIGEVRRGRVQNAICDESAPRGGGGRSGPAAGAGEARSAAVHSLVPFTNSRRGHVHPCLVPPRVRRSLRPTGCTASSTRTTPSRATSRCRRCCPGSSNRPAISSAPATAPSACSAPDHLLEQFVHYGMDPETVAGIGALPKGLGLLRVMVDHPAAHPAPTTRRRRALRRLPARPPRDARPARRADPRARRDLRLAVPHRAGRGRVQRRRREVGDRLRRARRHRDRQRPAVRGRPPQPRLAQRLR